MYVQVYLSVCMCVCVYVYMYSVCVPVCMYVHVCVSVCIPKYTHQMYSCIVAVQRQKLTNLQGSMTILDGGYLKES